MRMSWVVTAAVVLGAVGAGWAVERPETVQVQVRSKGVTYAVVVPRGAATLESYEALRQQLSMAGGEKVQPIPTDVRLKVELIPTDVRVKGVLCGEAGR